VTANPKITIIINSHNYAAYIGQAIDSALLQDYPNKEVIVVDDGSTDASPKIIASYGLAIKPIFNENMGQARTCLSAVRQATGDYILFLDSDDYLLPGAIAAVAAVCGPTVAKVQFQLLPVGATGEVVGKPWPKMAEQSRLELITLIEQRGTYPTPPNSGNVHRKVIFSYIDDIDYEQSIDGVACLIAPLLGEVRQIAQPLACYRYHSSNFSDHGNLNASRFALEAQRHKARLGHLIKIAEENDLPVPHLVDPASHSFVHTREILKKTSEGQRPGWPLVLRYARSLSREGETFGTKLKLWAWAFATQVSADRLRRKLAIYRSDPHSRGSWA